MTERSGTEVGGDEAERFLALAAESESHLSGTENRAWTERLEANLPGLRSAFAWFIGHGRGTDALRIAASLWRLQSDRGDADEARAMLSEALAAPGAEGRSPLRAQALVGAGTLAFRGLDSNTARRRFEECLSIAEELANLRLIVNANSGLARVALRVGDTSEVRSRSRASLAAASERGERQLTATPLHMLAAAARVEGNYPEAIEFYEKNLKLNRELDDPLWVACELGNIGAVRVLQGEPKTAVALLRESLESADRQHNRYLVPYEIVWLGRVAHLMGNSVRAAKLLASARSQFEATGLAMDPDEAPEFEKGVALIRGALTPADFDRAWEEGKRMDYDQAVAYALREEPTSRTRDSSA